jgi:hypothetical protein
VSGVTRVATSASTRTTEPLAREPGLQYSILFAQERDHGGLLGMEPSAQGDDQQLEGELGRSLRHRHRIQSWDTTAFSGSLVVRRLGDLKAVAGEDDRRLEVRRGLDAHREGAVAECDRRHLAAAHQRQARLRFDDAARAERSGWK